MEPLHYCFVQAEGLIPESSGMSFEELGELMLSLGCRDAYNFDGGQSAYIYWNGELASKNFYRNITDILYIADTIPEEGGEA